MIIRKYLLAIVMSALMLTGCVLGNIADPGVSTDGYPQMYDEDMLISREAIEETHNVKFLGAYADGLGCFIFWVQELGPKAEGCISTFICEDGTLKRMKSCGAGYELYLDVCKDIGNCL